MSNAEDHTLWYRQPANLWQDALPIGNGRLGAMVRGTTNTDRLWMNEDSAWYGGPQQRINASAKQSLPKIRERRAAYLAHVHGDARVRSTL
jgi:alpha-L-fucosidase 2